MIKYASYAVALKFFSLAPTFYHYVAQITGERHRIKKGLPSGLLGQGKRFIAEGLVRDGDRVLEIGTGWSHWLSMCVKMFFDVELVCYDVRDNRQFNAFQRYMMDLRGRLGEFGQPEDRVRCAEARMGVILGSKNFEEVYQNLGIKYVTSLEGLEPFHLVMSNNVLEHVHRSLAPGLVGKIQKLLMTGGYSFHQWDMTDHLSKYDLNSHKKNYLRFSERTWRFIGNDVQYINRMQRSEWLRVFKESGLELEKEQSLLECPIDGLTVHQEFSSLSKQDLSCGYLVMVHKKRA
ncbi:MAG: methyltransferase domain-containing protein [Bacteroidota bacterium]